MAWDDALRGNHNPGWDADLRGNHGETEPTPAAPPPPQPKLIDAAPQVMDDGTVGYLDQNKKFMPYTSDKYVVQRVNGGYQVFAKPQQQQQEQGSPGFSPLEWAAAGINAGTGGGLSTMKKAYETGVTPDEEAAFGVKTALASTLAGGRPTGSIGSAFPLARFLAGRPATPPGIAPPPAQPSGPQPGPWSQFPWKEAGDLAGELGVPYAGAVKKGADFYNAMMDWLGGDHPTAQVFQKAQKQYQANPNKVTGQVLKNAQNNAVSAFSQQQPPLDPNNITPGP